MANRSRKHSDNAKSRSSRKDKRSRNKYRASGKNSSVKSVVSAQQPTIQNGINYAQTLNNGEQLPTNQTYSTGGYNPQQVQQGIDTSNLQPSYYEQPQQGYFVQRSNTTVQGAQGKPYTLTKEQRKARRKHAEELRKRRRYRRILGILLFITLLLGAFVLIRAFSGSSELIPQDELDMADVEDDDDDEENYDGEPIATILFAGDISTSADQVAAVTRNDNTYDFAAPFKNIAHYIDEADYAVASFETNLISDMDYGVEPYYNSPIQLAGTLRSLGFRLVSTANTHMLDNGVNGVITTMDNLTAARIKHVGTYASQEERDTNGGAYIRTIHGIKFAFLSYTKGTDSVSMPDGCEYILNTLYTDYSDYWSDLRTSQIQSDVQAARNAGAEVVVALLHWGSEYSRGITPSQEEATELLVSCGVDVIVGTHSHLLNRMGYETVELADGTKNTCFVAYGLGDFYTDPSQDSDNTSVLLSLTFSRDRYGNISIEPHYVPIYLYVSPDEERTFTLIDSYSTLAALQRLESMNYLEASLYNELLDSIDTIHTYADETMDVGPIEEDTQAVAEAIERGQISSDRMRSLREAAEDDAENREKEIAAAQAAADRIEENKTDSDASESSEISPEATEEPPVDPEAIDAMPE